MSMITAFGLILGAWAMLSLAGAERLNGLAAQRRQLPDEKESASPVAPPAAPPALPRK
jgi:hypothetical protein